MDATHTRLVLSRREDESISLTTASGEVITLTVTKLRSSRVTLLLELPESVHVKRSELEKRSEAA